MGAFVKGDVVVANFPFSDLSNVKKRPALVLASFPKDRVILCQITSKAPDDPVAVSLADADFVTGSLKQSSFVRPNYVFTADAGVIAYRVGTITKSKCDEVVNKLVKIVSST